MVGAGFRVGEAHKEEVATEAKQNGGIIVKQAKKGKGLTEPSGTVKKKLSFGGIKVYQFLQVVYSKSHDLWE